MTEPVEKEWVDAISIALRVGARLQESLHIVVRGEKERVKKAVEMLYQLQMLSEPRSKRMSKKRPKRGVAE